MREYAASLIRALELPFRVLRLCGGDLSFTSALTYDFESTAATACTGLTVCVLTVDGVPLEIEAGLIASSWEYTPGLDGAALSVEPDPEP